jgi:type II secretory pathway pseudopilin PulG
MALDKKEIALSVVGVLAGLALTYLLWMRSQQNSANESAAAAAQAAATAATQEQEEQQYDAVSQGLSSAGSGSGTIYESSPAQTSSSDVTDPATSSDIGSIISQLLGSGSGTLPTIPANALIPEVSVSDGSTSLSGIDTSAAAILGYAPASTVSTTTSTGQTYGATTSPSAGTTAPGDVTTTGATPIFSTGGGDPKSTLTSLQSVS